MKESSCVAKVSMRENKVYSYPIRQAAHVRRLYENIKHAQN